MVRGAVVGVGDVCDGAWLGMSVIKGAVVRGAVVEVSLIWGAVVVVSVIMGCCSARVSVMAANCPPTLLLRTKPNLMPTTPPLSLGNCPQ